jgi:hypothetical protein
MMLGVDSKSDSDEVGVGVPETGASSGIAVGLVRMERMFASRAIP